MGIADCWLQLGLLVDAFGSQMGPGPLAALYKQLAGAWCVVSLLLWWVGAFHVCLQHLVSASQA